MEQDNVIKGNFPKDMRLVSIKELSMSGCIGRSAIDDVKLGDKIFAQADAVRDAQHDQMRAAIWGSPRSYEEDLQRLIAKCDENIDRYQNMAAYGKAGDELKTRAAFRRALTLYKSWCLS